MTRDLIARCCCRTHCCILFHTPRSRLALAVDAETTGYQLKKSGHAPDVAREHETGHSRGARPANVLPCFAVLTGAGLTACACVISQRILLEDANTGCVACSEDALCVILCRFSKAEHQLILPVSTGLLLFRCDGESSVPSAHSFARPLLAVVEP